MDQSFFGTTISHHPSPDSEMIYSVVRNATDASGTLYRVPVIGGPPQESWSQSQVRLFWLGLVAWIKG